nr:RNA-directed DNA polymerase, eukaryota [Tanacetum cinerariifolium]
MSGAHPTSNLKFKNFQDVTATTYVTNFPPSLETKDLWKLCDKCGTVADVYIARKLSKIGRRFAFVRFLKVKNKESLIEDLNKIWIGSYHMFAAMARFEKKPNTFTKTNPNTARKHPYNPSKTTFSSNQANPNRSYANALNGNNSSSPATQTKTILKSISLNESDLIDTSDMKNAILAKVRDVNLILNIKNVLDKEGFCNFQCKYIGGLWLWIEFDSPKACTKLQTNKEMSWYFTSLKQINKSFVADERVIWIEIGGLPLNAWTTKSFKKIALSWGEPLFVDEDPSENNAIGRVCFKTKIQGLVNEVCKVVILESPPSIHSDMENNNKHDLDFNDNDSYDEEEGEIPNDNTNHEDEYVRDSFWADEASNVEKKQDGFTDEQHDPPIKKNEVPKEDSNSFSKPPGFEGYKSNSPLISTGGNRNSFKQPSNCSSAPTKATRASKSRSKSINQGSMIEAFISNIEMVKVLETHSIKIDPFKVKSSWGNSQFDYAECPSSRRSGGLLSIWDPNVFSMINIFPCEHYLIVEVLDCHISDHWPILLSPSKHDFGPIPFKFFNSWLSDAKLNTIVTEFWDQYVPGDHHANPIVAFKNKMKDLKYAIKAWSSNRNSSQSQEKEDLIKKIKDFDDKMATQSDPITDANLRSSWIDKLRDIVSKENQDIAQKAKIKWGVEADENTRFFHATINKKRRSVPAAIARSVPAAVARSVPAAVARSVLAAVARSVPAAVARSVNFKNLDRLASSSRVYSCIMFRHSSKLMGIPLLLLILIHSIRISYDICLAASAGNGTNVAISLISVLEINERFSNSNYGFLLGKRMAYPVVENYVKNTWSKYGLVKTIMNSKGLFFFKYTSKDGIETMFENGQ